MKIIKVIINWIMFALGADSEPRKKSVNDGICRFDGQGRDEYGR